LPWPSFAKLVAMLAYQLCESAGARKPVLTALRNVTRVVGCHRRASLPVKRSPKSL
jgi:hypothetical protein